MSDRIEDILKQYGVLKEGHFLLTSGLHSGQYFEKFRILEHPELVTLFAGRIAEAHQDKGVTIVCGPTTGGVIIAFEVARQLKARCVVAEKSEPSGRKIGRGFQFAAEDRILVVDDVLTTGGSVNDTLEALKAFAGPWSALPYSLTAAPRPMTTRRIGSGGPSRHSPCPITRSIAARCRTSRRTTARSVLRASRWSRPGPPGRRSPERSRKSSGLITARFLDSGLARQR